MVQADPMFSPGDLSREVRQLRAEVDALKSQRRLESASIGAGGLRVRGGKIEILDAEGEAQLTLSTGGLTLTGLLKALGDIELNSDGRVRSVDFDGDLDEDDPGTNGWALGSGKAAFADLLLRDGIIGDSKLTNLVRTDTMGDTADRASVSSVETLPVSMSVPDWAQTASIIAVGSVFLAGIAPPDTPSFENYLTIEGSEGVHNAATVHQEGNATATVHHQRTMPVGDISGNLHVTLRADVNQPGNAFGIRLFTSVIVVWSR